VGILTVGFTYTTEELYELWCKFSDEVDAVRLLSDFIGRGDNRERARALIREFERRREVESLSYKHMG